MSLPTDKSLFRQMLAADRAEGWEVSYPDPPDFVPPEDTDDVGEWVPCDGCGRMMTEDQAERAQCSFLVRCAGCMAEHAHGCIACGAE